MLFQVKLIEVPNFIKLSGQQVASLFVNARHIAGNFWCFEGDIEAFDFMVVEQSDGAIDSTSHGDYNDEEFVRKCTKVFDWDFTNEPPMWKVLNS